MYLMYVAGGRSCLCWPRPLATSSITIAFPTATSDYRLSGKTQWHNLMNGHHQHTCVRAMVASSQPRFRVIHVLVPKRTRTKMVEREKRTQSTPYITGPRSFGPLGIFSSIFEPGHCAEASFTGRGDDSTLSTPGLPDTPCRLRNTFARDGREEKLGPISSAPTHTYPT